MRMDGAPEMNYEKIAAEVKVGEELEGFLETPTPEIDTSVQSSHAREFLPPDHQKYQGLAEAKGYEQHDKRLQKVRYSHDAMIDVLITEPEITQNELAIRFGRTPGWISVVMGSDAFQGALAKRRDDVMNPDLVATLEERYRGLADQSLRILSDKLEATKNTDLALKSLEISGKALGFGARQAGGNVTNNNFVVALPGKIANSDDWVSAHTKDVTPKALPGG